MTANSRLSTVAEDASSSAKLNRRFAGSQSRCHKLPLVFAELRTLFLALWKEPEDLLQICKETIVTKVNGLPEWMASGDSNVNTGSERLLNLALADCDEVSGAWEAQNATAGTGGMGSGKEL